MATRAWGWWAVSLGLWACGAGDEAPSESAPASAPGDQATPLESDVAPVSRYQFVSTPDGMAVEAVSEDQVQTFSCRTNTCASLCDECAARACQAAGSRSDTCASVVSNCNDSCSCQGRAGSTPGCGFPVCALDRMICYVGDEADEPRLDPSAPIGPSPVEPAGRPGEASADQQRPTF